VGVAAADELPDVRSRAVAVLDADTGAEVFGKQADEVRAIASTTKIFFARTAFR
jgi:D-alanyl-D-alanine carboxypeptidase